MSDIVGVYMVFAALIVVLLLMEDGAQDTWEE